MCQVETTGIWCPFVNKNVHHIFHKTNKKVPALLQEVPGGEGLRELRKFLASTCFASFFWNLSIEIHDGCWRFRTTTEGRWAREGLCFRGERSNLWSPCHAWLPVSHRFVTLQVRWSGCTGWRNSSIQLASGGVAEFHLFHRGMWYLFFNLVLTNPQAAPPGAIPRGMEVEGLYAEDGGRFCLSLLSQDVFGYLGLCRFLTC